MSYSGILDQVCRKSLSLTLLAFLGSLVTSSLFVRMYTGVFVLGALLSVLLVWTEAALLSWISELTVYRNIFIALRSIHILASEQLFQMFSLDFRSDGPFMGLLVIIGIGVGFALVFIPPSPAFFLEKGEVLRSKRELGKWCVLHDENYGIAMGLRKEDDSQRNDLRRLDKILVVLMICGSMFCHSSSFNHKQHYPTSKLSTNVLTYDTRLFSVIQISAVVLQSVILGLVTSRTVLKVLLAAHFTVIINLMILTLWPMEDVDPAVFLKLSLVTQSMGTLIKTLITQTLLYISLRKTPVSCKHRVLSLLLGMSTFGDSVHEILGSESVFVLTNSALLCLVVLPKLFGISQVDTRRFLYQYM
ncbi:hypothetical protein ACHWQZ_G016060 [Mnemiopsis leidyi]